MSGPTGSDGDDGPVGVRGPTGDDGPVGTIGIAGPTGPTGDDGPTGIGGPTGPTGTIGGVGIDGEAKPPPPLVINPHALTIVQRPRPPLAGSFNEERQQYEVNQGNLELELTTMNAALSGISGRVTSLETQVSGLLAREGS